MKREIYNVQMGAIVYRLVTLYCAFSHAEAVRYAASINSPYLWITKGAAK